MRVSISYGILNYNSYHIIHDFKNIMNSSTKHVHLLLIKLTCLKIVVKQFIKKIPYQKSSIDIEWE